MWRSSTSTSNYQNSDLPPSYESEFLSSPVATGRPQLTPLRHSNLSIASGSAQGSAYSPARHQQPLNQTSEEDEEIKRISVESLRLEKERQEAVAEEERYYAMALSASTVSAEQEVLRMSEREVEEREFSEVLERSKVQKGKDREEEESDLERAEREELEMAMVLSLSVVSDNDGSHNVWKGPYHAATNEDAFRALSLPAMSEDFGERDNGKPRIIEDKASTWEPRNNHGDRALLNGSSRSSSFVVMNPDDNDAASHNESNASKNFSRTFDPPLPPTDKNSDWASSASFAVLDSLPPATASTLTETNTGSTLRSNTTRGHSAMIVGDEEEISSGFHRETEMRHRELDEEGASPSGDPFDEEVAAVGLEPFYWDENEEGDDEDNDEDANVGVVEDEAELKEDHHETDALSSLPPEPTSTAHFEQVESPTDPTYSDVNSAPSLSAAHFTRIISEKHESPYGHHPQLGSTSSVFTAQGSPSLSSASLTVPSSSSVDSFATSNSFGNLRASPSFGGLVDSSSVNVTADDSITNKVTFSFVEPCKNPHLATSPLEHCAAFPDVAQLSRLGGPEEGDSSKFSNFAIEAPSWHSLLVYLMWHGNSNLEAAPLDLQNEKAGRDLNCSVGLHFFVSSTDFSPRVRCTLSLLPPTMSSRQSILPTMGQSSGSNLNHRSDVVIVLPDTLLLPCTLATLAVTLSKAHTASRKSKSANFRLLSPNASSPNPILQSLNAVRDLSTVIDSFKQMNGEAVEEDADEVESAERRLLNKLKERIKRRKKAPGVVKGGADGQGNGKALDGSRELPEGAILVTPFRLDDR